MFDTLCHDAFQVHPYATTPSATNSNGNSIGNSNNNSATAPNNDIITTPTSITSGNTDGNTTTDTPNTNTKVGMMTECLISVGSKQEEEADALHPDIITRLENEYKYIPIDPTSYYTTDTTTANSNTNNTTTADSNIDPTTLTNGSTTSTAPKGHNSDLHLNRILTWYQDRYKNESEGASIMFPIGALRVLERLSRLSRERGRLVCFILCILYYSSTIYDRLYTCILY